MDAALAAQNRQTMTKLLVIAVAMLGFGFAMVPMYRQICESLGITQSRVVGATNTQVDASRSVTVELARLQRRAAVDVRGARARGEAAPRPARHGELPRGEHARAAP